MKEKLKKLQFLFFICLAGHLFFSCNKDDDSSSNNSNDNFKVEQKSFDELIKTSKFSRAMSLIPTKKKNSLRNLDRTIMEDKYAFTIYDTPINVTENDTVIAYNILIQSDTLKKGNYFENLVINIDKATNMTSAFIVKFNLTSEITQTQHESFYFESNLEIYEILYNDSPSPLSKQNTVCYQYHYVTCTNDGHGGPGGEHFAGSNCTNSNFLHHMTLENCTVTEWEPNNFPGNEHMNQNPNGSYSGGGVLSNPTQPCNSCPILFNDIEELLKLTNNKLDGSKTNIMIKINQLKSDLATATFEGGAMYNSSQISFAPSVVAPTETNWGGVPREYHIKLHRHQDNYTPIGTSLTKPTNPVESDMDVFNFLKLHDYTQNKNTTDLFVSRLGTFAIRVNNRAKAKNAYKNLLNSPTEWKAYTAAYDAAVTILYESPPPLNEAQIKINFINFIKTYLVNGETMGISIYQAQFDLDGNITGWIQL